MVQYVVPTSEPAWATGPVAPGLPAPKQTPLYATHVAFGARFVEYAGMVLPYRYTGVVAESHAVRRAAGLFDLGFLGEIAVTGRDAAALLDYALVGDVTTLPIGRARYMMLCRPDGGILEDVVVCRLDATEYLVLSNSTDVRRLISELRTRGNGHDARVYDRTDDYAVIGIEGPRAAEILTSITAGEPATLHHYATLETTVGGHDTVIARSGYTGDDGFECYCAPDDAEDLWYALAEAGAAHGIQPAGVACRDALRIEAGVALHGRELTTEVTPYDARLGAVVALGKDDFVGKAALVERVARGGGSRLTGLIGDERQRTPRAGHAVLDRTDGRQVGVVTSGVRSPTLGRPIALAYVEAATLDRDADLAVDVRGTPESVEVATLPFYRGRRARPAGVPAGGLQQRLRRLMQVRPATRQR